MKKRPQAKNPPYLIYALLVISILAIYWQVSTFDFINTDDQTYVAQNRHIQSGLTLSSVQWAFTTCHAANWHPLTWMSHMLDWRLFGSDAGSHHLMNVFLHLASVLLLFYLLSRLTGYPWRSAFVAALFAIHPLHVESVAWVSERKDVLSTFFWMLTLLAYVHYAASPSVKRYLLVAPAFALGLLAKPMLVTLPLVLLLIDYWPLRRNDRNNKPVPMMRLVLEKIPLLCLSAASCAATFWAQHTGQAVMSLRVFPIGVRAANAAVASVGYIVKTISPLNLAAFYPHPGNTLPAWQVIGSVLLLAAVTGLCVWQTRRRPYLLVGWLWYVITLLPVIGFVQVGLQAMADRYTYIPLIGIFIIIGWLIPDIPFLRARFVDANSPLNRIGRLAVAVVLIGLAVSTYFQVGYWRDSITLNEHAINVTEDNYFAYNNLGSALVEKGQVKEGIARYLSALKANPSFPEAHYNLAIALARIGNLDAALAQYREAARLNPSRAEVYNNMGSVLGMQDKLAEAEEAFAKALALDPNHAETYHNLGCVAAQQGKYKEAVGYFSKAMELDPTIDGIQQKLKMAESLANTP